MATEALERAIQSTGKVLENVSADQLSAPSVCAPWDVKALINHIIGGLHWFEAVVNGEEISGEAPDFTKGDLSAAFQEAAAKAVAAFQQPGALDRTLTLPWGEMPGGAFLGVAATDTFTHGWDLARSTGQSSDLDPELAVQLLAAARLAIPDHFRGTEGAPFGPIVEVPESAPAADQLAGFLGRQVT